MIFSIYIGYFRYFVNSFRSDAQLNIINPRPSLQPVPISLYLDYDNYQSEFVLIDHFDTLIFEYRPTYYVVLGLQLSLSRMLINSSPKNKNNELTDDDGQPCINKMTIAKYLTIAIVP